MINGLGLSVLCCDESSGIGPVGLMPEPTLAMWRRISCAHAAAKGRVFAPELLIILEIPRFRLDVPPWGLLSNFAVRQRMDLDRAVATLLPGVW